MDRFNFQTKSDVIYRELKRDIVNGKYKPQERIIISDVAKEFGTSDIPVREAIKHLESDGLVRNTPYVGAMVTSFDLEDIRKIFQIRSVLEGMATRMAVSSIGDKQLKSLGKTVVKMEKAVEHKQFGSLAQLNEDYHNVIYSAAGNEYLKKIIFELWNFSLRSRAIFSFDPHRARKAVSEHKEILEALKIGDGKSSEKLIIKHMESSLAALQLYFEHIESEGKNSF